MKIWIVTSKFGQGHLSVAQALKEDFEDQGHDVIISDLLAIKYPTTSKVIYSTFNKIICKSKHIYNFAAALGQHTSKDTSHKNVYKALDQIKPDIIISTWSACAREFSDTTVPIYTCITDIGVHDGWLDDKVTGYFVASQATKEALEDKGVESQKIIVSGIPVKKCFSSAVKKKGKKKKILIMGGGLGLMSWLDQTLNQLVQMDNVEVTVITGNNKKLCDKLKKSHASIHVMGFTDRIHDYMAEADLILSKPGGVSLFESINVETPFIAIYPQYVHEKVNASFIADQGIGKVVDEGQSIMPCVMTLINDDSALKALGQNMRLMKAYLSGSKMHLDRLGCNHVA